MYVLSVMLLIGIIKGNSVTINLVAHNLACNWFIAFCVCDHLQERLSLYGMSKSDSTKEEVSHGSS